MLLELRREEPELRHTGTMMKGSQLSSSAKRIQKVSLATTAAAGRELAGSSPASRASIAAPLQQPLERLSGANCRAALSSSRPWSSRSRGAAAARRPPAAPATHAGARRDQPGPAVQLQRGAKGRQHLRVGLHHHWALRSVWGAAAPGGRVCRAVARPVRHAPGSPERAVARRQPVRGRRLLPRHCVSSGLPLQASQGAARKLTGGGGSVRARPHRTAAGPGGQSRLEGAGVGDACAGDVPHAHLPLQHQQQRRHLPRHPQGPVEPRAHRVQGPALHLLAAYRLQPQ